MNAIKIKLHINKLDENGLEIKELYKEQFFSPNSARIISSNTKPDAVPILLWFKGILPLILVG